MEWSKNDRVEYSMLISKIADLRQYFSQEEIDYYAMMCDPMWVLEGIEDVLKERKRSDD